MQQYFDGADFDALRTDSLSAGFIGQIFVENAANILALKVMQHIMKHNGLNEKEMEIAKESHDDCLKDLQRWPSRY